MPVHALQLIVGQIRGQIRIGFCIQEGLVLRGVLAVADRGVALVVELTVGQMQLLDDLPQVSAGPLYHGVDSLKIWIALMHVAIRNLADMCTAGVILPRSHHDPL